MSEEVINHPLPHYTHRVHRWAIFKPLDVTTLRPEYLPLIGKECYITNCYWLIEETETFAGQYAMQVEGFWEWVPSGDLQFIDGGDKSPERHVNGDT